MKTAPGVVIYRHQSIDIDDIDWFPISISIDQLRLDLIKQRKVQFLVEFVFINKKIILSFKVWSGF